MNELKAKVLDSSLFRRYYIIDLLLCTVSYVQNLAYIIMGMIYIWGVFLAFYNQKRYGTFYKMRFGIWIGLFFAVTLLSTTVNIFFSDLLGMGITIAMLFNSLICFCMFYGMHTEPEFSFKEDLYFVARAVVYISTVANIIGIFCLMVGIRFDWGGNKFIIYENRFTGVFYNPNVLGFISVVAIVCCHILYKKDFMSAVQQKRVSKIWITACIATNAFSLMLCDSNASLVLALGYAITYVVYIFFAEKAELSFGKILGKFVSIILVGTFLTGSVLMFRTICQEGFAVVFSKTNSIFFLLTDEEIQDSEKPGKPDAEKKDNTISFTHQNKNVDSGRFKLWNESINLFRVSPVIGISYGNVFSYSQKYGNGLLQIDSHNNDIHNGYLTVLVSVGALGLILFCIFGFRFTKHSAQHLFMRRKTYRDDAYPCLFAFLFAYLAYALFEKALLYDVSFLVTWFWLMMGYMGCYVESFEKRLKRRPLFKNGKFPKLTRSML